MVRIGRAGDMVMITPAVRALLDLAPEAELHMLTSADGQRVFRGFSPRLTRFVLHDRSALIEGVRRARLRRRLAAEGYDAVLCFETSPGLAAFADAGVVGHCLRPDDPPGPYALRCLRLIERAFDAQLAGTCWSHLPVTEDGRARARALLAGAGIDEDAFVIGLHPTYSGLRKAPWRRSADAGRRWPPESFAALARDLAQLRGPGGRPLRLLMELLPDEAEIGETIVRASAGAVTLLTPAPDFERYKATLERMDLLVTTDTGAMHIAGAVGTRLVALFAGTDPASSGPWVPPGRCITIRSPSERMADIPPERAFEVCRRVLQGDEHVAATA